MHVQPIRRDACVVDTAVAESVEAAAAAAVAATAVARLSAGISFDASSLIAPAARGAAGKEFE